MTALPDRSKTFPSDKALDKATGAFRFCLEGLTRGNVSELPSRWVLPRGATLLLWSASGMCSHLIAVRDSPYMLRHGVACIPRWVLSLHTVAQQHGYYCWRRTCWELYMALIFYHPLPMPSSRKIFVAHSMVEGLTIDCSVPTGYQLTTLPYFPTVWVRGKVR